METLPLAARSVIDHYFNLNLGGKSVACPYYINTGHIKDLRVMVGKGTPEEIEMETRIWAQLKGRDLNHMSGEQIRSFMHERHIGVDCSGFVYHVLQAWILSLGQGSLIRYIRFPYLSLLGRIKLQLRPAENIGVEVLTSDLNSNKVGLSEIRPGDLIRSKAPRQNAQHVLLVSEIGRAGDQVSYFKYVHSISQFGAKNGVREGKVEVVDQNAELKDQRWLEVDETGSCPTLEGLKINYQDNGLRRLSFLAKYN